MVTSNDPCSYVRETTGERILAEFSETRTRNWHVEFLGSYSNSRNQSMQMDLCLGRLREMKVVWYLSVDEENRDPANSEQHNDVAECGLG